MTPDLEQKLCKALRDHPYKFLNRYTDDARAALLDILFRSLTNDRSDYLSGLFPKGFPESYKLSDAQGNADRSEYSDAARGHPCGHIFKQGEASYHCTTCTDDATCVLCSQCFDASDHEGHQFHISASAGNSGCCDCGDVEAWKRTVHCAIHTATENTSMEDQPSPLPPDMISSIQITIARVLDYFCDVISCSPEQLRMVKTEASIRDDESFSRLESKWYGRGDEEATDPEYCLTVWNDEKHTVVEVSDVIKRACRKTTKFGFAKAWEANDVGRSILRHSRDLKELIRMSGIVESIKVTTTIRTSRDTFREQMCGTILEWLSDIARCSVGQDHHILRYTICEQMLQQWRIGSEAYNAQIGRSGIDDHEYTETTYRFTSIPGLIELPIAPHMREEDGDTEEEVTEAAREAETDSMDVEEFLDEHEFHVPAMRLGGREAFPAHVLTEDHRPFNDITDTGVTTQHDSDEGDADQTPQPGRPLRQATIFTPSESDPGESGPVPESENRNYRNVPRTPHGRRKRPTGAQPTHWSTQPVGLGSAETSNTPPHEDLHQNIRLDSMILFDMRMWKKIRIDLRDLYISTVVNVPAFKRILGLRFSGLYTSLSQLYLIADREPDHSIINLSLQMLTSPSITAEVIERGNFLTNLMAILYTFLTSRQVGFPQDVSSSATLAFDTGSVTNRRLYHFFTDLRYFLSSEPVQRKVREDKQYLLQFIDLIKLSQGICPNVRAVGEHVEYETDAWIGASLLTREINKLCRQFSDAFYTSNGHSGNSDDIAYVIYTTAFSTLVHSVGLERKRFNQTEIKELAQFKQLRAFEFEREADQHGGREHRVIDFVVEDGALSFHHALHYTLSWLIEAGKSLSNSQMRDVLHRVGSDVIKQHGQLTSSLTQGFHDAEDASLALFDFPLRVCAWLAQMKAGSWVRNGMSLRHQMSQYKGVSFRDVGYHRDIFLLQTAFVTCDPSRFLATMIDRYGLENWMRGNYEVPRSLEDLQMVDILEDFIYLIITILTDRASLITVDDEPDPRLAATRKDLIHALCFKPLSFSDINAKLNEKVQDYERLQTVLEEMTTFRAPEGLTDSGTFELKPEYIEQLDPYNSNYNKNQREEAENIYRKWMSKRVGKPAEDIVLEPKLHPITSGVFTGLSSFTKSPLFAQVIFYALGYALAAGSATPNVPATRLESLLQVVLQLAFIATLEDDTTEDDFTEDSMQSFIRFALTIKGSTQTRGRSTIVEVLQMISTMDDYVSCRPKIKHVLKLFYRKRQHDFSLATTHLDFPFGRLDTVSPANVEQGLENRKKQALERKAKVMAQFQQQQKTFMDNQGVSEWLDDDLSDAETEGPIVPEKKVWKYPTGACILCQEETNDGRVYGTFGMFTESNVLRKTNIEDMDWVREVTNTPSSLDRTIEHIRPFGVSGENHEPVVRLTAEGQQVTTDRQGLGKGWPNGFTHRSPVSSGCGHLMHFACFDHYFRSVLRRHATQIARHHPERTENLEFVCPLCKALGNAFLPILWKEKEESYPGVLANEESLESFLDGQIHRLLLWQGLVEQRDTEGLSHPQTPLKGHGAQEFKDLMVKVVAFGRSMNPTSPLTSSIMELSRIFTRLKETMTTNLLDRVGMVNSSSPRQVSHLEVLISLIGSTVSAVEIGHRGVAVEPGNTLPGTISEQTLSHLRILSGTAKAFILNSSTSVDSSVDDLSATQRRLLLQLFARPTTDNRGSEKQDEMTVPAPLLLEDIFGVFAQGCLILGSTTNMNIHLLLRLCYLAQVVQTVTAYVHNTKGLADLIQNPGHQRSHSLSPIPPTRSEVHAMSALTEWIAESVYYSGYRPCKLAPEFGEPLYALVRSYCLAFLRKATILLHVSQGLDIPSLSDYDTPELDRLSRLLRLPSLEEVLSDFQSHTGKQSIKDQVTGWICALAPWQHCREVEARHPGLSRPPLGFGQGVDGPEILNLARGMNLPHPAPFELIGLPKHFDVLMEEANRRKCPTTGKDLTDPALCLFCGAILCSQAVCCMPNEIGPVNLHVEKCSSQIGLFLSIRKCTILMLHIAPKPAPPTSSGSGGSGNNNSNSTRPLTSASSSPSSSSSSSSPQESGAPRSNGGWFHAPYLTRHGEVDPGLRQRHQLVLSQKRYDRLSRDVWLMLSGNVWSNVARKLETESNGGGWESI